MSGSSAALPERLPRLMTGSGDRRRSPEVVHGGASGIVATQNLGEVEAVWRRLEANGIESPGQSYDFIKLWVESRGISPRRQLYIVGSFEGAPVALLALRRKVVRGIRQLAWFPGPHVGCNAPLVDAKRLAEMTSDERRTLWTDMLAGIRGADVLYLKSVPQTLVDGIDVFAELGELRAAETLYRSEFQSWDQATATQRSKSRRKHDRQQGEKLAALGAVTFEEVGGGAAALPVLDVMFKQRAARFVEMGVPNPFAPHAVRRFYDATLTAPGVETKLHVLRLNGEIVAVRYNIVHRDRMFCLISSMSDDVAIQVGSPGKQCLLRVMQQIFDAGYRVFDMGAGFTDEKRHWCNVQIPVRHHYLALTRRGAAAASLHRLWQMSRARIKSDTSLMAIAKTYRVVMLRLTGKKAEDECSD
jgi:CelD/BcsL family acetyltransferase involved in cellulose biosynthesis